MRPTVYATAALLAACAAARCPPPRAAPENAPARGADEARTTPPALRGTYRVVTLAGEPVVRTLVRDPSCYAARALFTFHDDGAFSFSLETACSGSEQYETVCTAELTTTLAWEVDAFRVVAAARARGMVSQFYQPETPEEESADGDFDDACHVGVSPMRWRVRSRDGDTLELENEHGDVMELVRESTEAVDWRAVTREAHRARAAQGG